MLVKKILFPAVLFLALALSPGEALAAVQDGGGGSSPTITGSNIQELGAVLGRIINFLLGIVGAITIILIIWGGIRYIFASGDEKATLTAKHQIEYAILGLVIVLLAVFIVNFLGGLLGAGNLNVIKIGQ